MASVRVKDALRLFEWAPSTAAENLALDEALLDESEIASRQLETLRFWECASWCVVVGSCGKLREEVRLESCRRDGVPVLRRHSGGGTVLQGPGCLNFSLILSLESRPDLHGIHASFRSILGTIMRALCVDGLAIRGISDLALNARKVSGNAQRRKRRALLHQGTLLYEFDSARASRYLPPPPKQPDYRRNRTHEDFLTNLPLTASEIKTRVSAIWEGSQCDDLTAPDVGELVSAKYTNPKWINRFE